MSNLKKAYLAGGCFWCTEAIFSRLKGVIGVLPGYTGGGVAFPKYKQICLGITGHAEAIEIVYDKDIVSYTTLLEVFFSTHDPTTLNQQGNDRGTQYRSAIFCTDEAEVLVANNYIKKLTSGNIFKNLITTEVSLLIRFYEAEIEHKDYYDLNSNQPYCNAVISPKIKKLIENNQGLLK
jgi:peptide-methionine (S)-S-oxide reductase